MKKRFVAALQVTSALDILIDEVAGHKDTTIAKAVDQQFQQPGIVLGLCLHQLRQRHVAQVVPTQRHAQQVREEMYHQQADDYEGAVQRENVRKPAED